MNEFETDYIQVPKHIYLAVKDQLEEKHPGNYLIEALDRCTGIAKPPTEMIDLYYNNFLHALVQTKAYLQNADVSLQVVTTHFKELKK